jgi:hypothetical protein
VRQASFSHRNSKWHPRIPVAARPARNARR